MGWFRSRKAPPPSREGKEAGQASSPADWRSYDDVAEEYERVHAPQTAVVAADVLALAEVSSGARVLDVGTGTANALIVAADAVAPGGLAVGVDPAAGMLAAARRYRPGAPVGAAEAINLPFREEAFDVVLANFALPYFTKLDTALHDLVRVLRRGGRLAASVWGAGEDDLTRTWRELVEEAVGREILRSGLAEETPWAEKLSDPARLETTLRDAGLRPVWVSTRRYRFELSREDYVVGHETEASGRFVRAMLGPRLWEGFRERARGAYAERFPEQLLDFRDVLLAVGTKP